MAKASGGQVLWYATGTIEYTASFPNGEINCERCDFCRSENSGQRCRCLFTSEILYAPTKDIGRWCPLKITYPAGHEPASAIEED